MSDTTVYVYMTILCVYFSSPQLVSSVSANNVLLGGVCNSTADCIEDIKISCVDGLCTCYLSHKPNDEKTACLVERCDISPCYNGATCVDTHYGYSCQCPPGFNGHQCETNIDDCRRNQCLHGSTCVDLVDGYKCTCHPDYFGIFCENSVLAGYCERDEDYRDGVWDRTITGQTLEIHCPHGYNGTVRRTCGVDGRWSIPVYDCIREPIHHILSQLDILIGHSEPSETEIKEVLDSITMVTTQDDHINKSQLLTTAELASLVESLDIVARLLEESVGTMDVEAMIENFIQSTSNLLDSTNYENWKHLKEQSKIGVESVFSSMETFSRAVRSQVIVSESWRNMSVVADNLAFHLEQVTDSIQYPRQREKGEDDWLTQSQSKISLQLPSGSISTAVMYRNLSDIVSTRTEANDSSSSNSGVIVNGPVIGLSVTPHVQVLQQPVIITIKHFMSDYGKPRCSFWKYNEDSIYGYWSTEGCTVVSEEPDVTVCQCNHLTNFAVIMSPFKQVDPESEPLHFITLVGMSLSLICLMLTILIHGCFRRKLDNDRTTLLMNLCVALFIADLTFMLGVERVHNVPVCGAIAAFLHYIFLVVFSLMLVEGIEMTIMVTHVFASKSRIGRLAAAAWILPFLVVGTALGVTKTEGYGTEHFCWLSIESGLIWAFVGPACAIIVVNVVCLGIVFRKMCTMSVMGTKTRWDKIKSSVWLLCVLVPLLGITWLFGILYINHQLSVMQYIFAVCNSLQGFFIFLIQCIFNTKVRKAVKMGSKRVTSDEFSKSRSKTPSSTVVCRISNPVNDASRPTVYQRLKHYTDQRLEKKLLRMRPYLLDQETYFTRPLTPRSLTPLTPLPLTLQPLTPLTSEPLTSRPLTPRPLTSRPLTPRPLTSRPLTPPAKIMNKPLSYSIPQTKETMTPYFSIPPHYSVTPSKQTMTTGHLTEEETEFTNIGAENRRRNSIEHINSVIVKMIDV